MVKRKSSETPETPSKKQKLSQSSYGLGSKASSKTLETPSKKEQFSQSSYHLKSKTSTKTPQTPPQNTQVQADEATSIQMSTPTSKDSSSRGKKPVKLHRKRAHYSIQFRSNLSSVVSFFQTLKFNSKYLLELQKTPFWYLIQALTTGRMDPKKSRKSDDDVVAIIQCYNEKTKAFTVRKKNLTFTTNDMTLIFGLEGGKGAMSLRYSKKPKSAFLRRRFQKDTRLTGPVLKNALIKAMKGKRPTDFKDVGIIVTLYLCLTLFFATSGNSIGWVFIKYVEPLESMKQYDWSEAITSTLIDSIMALHKTPEKVAGCVIALLWNFQTLTKQLQKTPVHSLAHRQIDNKQLVKNPSEEFCLGKKTKKELKKAIVKFNETLQDPFEDQGNEQAEGNTKEYEASNGQKHQASSTEEETSEESEEIEPEDKEKNEQKEEDSEQEDEEEDEQQEENKDENDEEENNEPMDQQHDGICGSTMHQPEEFEESKDAQIADLRQRLKALSQSKKEEDRNWIELLAEKDISIRILTSHNSELQEKESTIRMKLRMLEVEKADDTKTIQQLRCSNSELETENAKLHEQVQELSVQLATQPYRTPTQLQPQVGMQVEQQPTTQQEQMPHKQQPKQKTKLYVKKDPTSMIKNLKAKERKEKQHDLEFQYPKVAKVTRASKQAAKQVEQSTKDKEVLDADAYVLPQPINIRKSWVFPQTLPISRLIKDHIKDILQHISNVSGLEALIWTSENCQQSWRNYRFLHFPINTRGNEKSTHGNHWTLLVLDKQDNLWRFYNSLRPRRDDAEDKYVKDAKQLITWRIF
ncbi:unnamed protein product [Camellia sinensis]